MLWWFVVQFGMQVRGAAAGEARRSISLQHQRKGRGRCILVLCTVCCGVGVGVPIIRMHEEERGE